MDDLKKSKKQLIEEINELRSYKARLERLRPKIMGEKKMEETLLESEEKFKAFTENVPDFIIQLDHKGMILFINQAYGEVSVEQVVGTSIFTWLEEEHRSVFQTALSHVFKKAELQVIEYLSIGPEGETRWYSGHIGPVKDKRRTESVILIARDITERKKLEEKLSAIVYKSPIATAVGGADGSIIAFNEALETLIGYQSSEVSDVADWTNKLYPDKEYREFVWKNIQQSLDGQKQDCTEFTITCKDGSTKVVDFHTSFFKGGLIIQMLDITERKKVEDALRESEEKYKDIVELAPDGIVTVDLKGMITSCNNALLEQTGYSKEDFVGRHISKIPTARIRDIPKYLKMFGSLLRGKVPKPFEFVWISKDGSEHWGDVRVSVLKRKGKVRGFQAITRDITERKKAEDAVRESEERFRTLFESAPDAIYLNDLEGNFVDGNRFAEELAGFARNELIGQSLLDIGLLSLEQIPKAIANLKKNAAGEPTGPDEFVLNRKDGSDIALEIRTYPVKIGEQKLSLGIARDITERKKAEEELRKLSLAVEQSANAIGIVDKEGRIEYVNPKLLEVYGQKPEDVVGKNWRDFISGNSSLREKMSEIRDTVLIRGEAWKGEVSDIDAGGQVIWRKSTIFPIKDEEGEVAHSVYISEDITERKRAVEALTMSDLRFRSLIEHTTDAVFCYEYDPPIPIDLGIEEQIKLLYDGVLVECNDVCAKSYGAQRAEEVVGKRLTELFETPPGGLDKLFELMIEGGYRVVDGEGVEKLEDGTSRYYLNNGHGVIEDGRLVRVWGTFRDITNRKKAEEELEVERDRAQKYLDVAGVMFVAINARGEITLMNKRGCAVLGYEEEEVVDKNWFDNFLPERVRKGVKSVFDELVAGEIEPVEYFENPVLTKDGEERIIAWHNTILRNEQGDITGTLSSGEDITDRKKAEETLRESEERYRVLVETMGDGLAVQENQLYTYVNNSFCKMAGYSRDELIGRGITTLFDGANQKKMEEQLARRKEGRDEAYEIELTAKDGHKVQTLVSPQPSHYNGRFYSGSFAVFTDITNLKLAEEALKASEEKYHSLIDNIPDVVWTTDENGNTTFISENIKDIYGYSPEEIYRKGDKLWFGRIHPDDAERVKESFKAIFEQGRKLDIEYRIRRKDGEWIWLKDRSIGAYEKDGVKYADGVFFDITERKKAEAALAESEQKFRAFFENEPEYCYMISPQGRVLEANRAALDALGYDREELIGKPLVTIYAPESRKMMRQVFGRWHRKGEIRDEEMVIVTKNGDRRTVLLSAAKVLDEGGRMLHSVSIQRDITERKKAEEAMKKSSIIIDSTTDAVITTDVAGNITFWNKGAEIIYGYQKEEAVGKPVSIIYKEEDRHILESMIADLMQGKDIPGIEVTCIDKNRRDVEILLSLTTIRDEDGNITELVGITKDITARKQMEERVVKSEELFSKAFYANPVPATITTVSNDKLLKVNNAWLKLIGFDSEEQAIGKSALELGLWADVVDREERNINLQQSGFSDLQEIKVRTPSGQIRNCIYTAEMIDYGGVPHILSMAIDITERKRAEAELTRLIAILENTSDMVSTAMPNSQLTYINTAGRKMLGWSDDEAITDKMIFDVHPRWAFELIEAEGVPGAIRDGIWSGESALLHRDGTEIPISQVIMSHKSPDGQVQYLSTIIRDITERKNAEEELKKSEERYKALFKGAPDGIIVADVETGQYIHVNPFICKRLGYSEEEIKGLSQFRGIHPKGETERIKRLFFMQASGEIDIAEDIPFVKKDGTICYFDVKSVCVEIDGIQRVIGLLRDITERKKAEEALRDSERKFRSITENAVDFIFIKDMARRYTFVNQAMQEMLGLREEEILGKTPEEIFGSAEGHIIKEVDDRTFSGETVNETRSLVIGGKELFLNTSQTPLTKEHGEVTSIMGIVRDVTERKKAEEALVASESKYRSLFDNSLEGIGLSKGNRVISANKAILDILGYDSIEEFTGIPLLDHVAPESREKIRERMNKREKGEPMTPTFEYKIIRKDGKVRDLEASSGEISIEGEKYTQSIFRDITEQKKGEEALKESESRFRQLVENIREVFWMENADGTDLLYVSPTYEQVWGRSCKSFYENPQVWIEAIHPDDRQRVIDAFSRFRETGVYSEEFRIMRPDGSTRWIWDRGVLIRNESGEVIRVAGIAEDITERKEAREALQQSEQRYHSLFETAGDAIFMLEMTDADARVVDCNSSTLEMFRCRREDIIGKSPVDFSPPVQADGVSTEQKVAEVMAPAMAGEPLCFEWLHCRLDGTTFHAEVSLNRVNLGDEAYLQAIVRDITERKEAAKQLQESEEKYRSVIENANIGVIVIQDGKRVFYNSKIHEMLGYTDQEYRQIDFISVIDPQDRTLASERIRQRLDGTAIESDSVEIRLLSKSGETKWIEADSAVIQWEGRTALQSFITDITERKQAEEKLLDYQERLKSLASELSLSEERQRRHIAAGLHDNVGQNLALFKIKLAEARKKAESSEFTESIDDICTQTDEIIQDVRNLTFDLSSPILYDKGLEAAIRHWLMKQIQEKYGLECVIDDDKQPKPLDENVRLFMFQAVRELLTNVVKHSQAEHVRVSIRRKNDKIRISVEDDGVGFVYAEQKMTESGGFGLFNISQRLDYIGGSVEIRSQADSGSRITLEAPLRCED